VNQTMPDYMNSVDEEIKEQQNLEDPYGLYKQSNIMQLNNTIKHSRSIDQPKMNFSSSR
jgi:hypothetical protein